MPTRGSYCWCLRLSPQYFFIRSETAVRFTADDAGARVGVREGGPAVRSEAGGDMRLAAADPAVRARIGGTAESRAVRFWRAGTDAASD